MSDLGLQKNTQSSQATWLNYSNKLKFQSFKYFNRFTLAQEGHDYFTNDNDLGVLTFGPAEVYKEVSIRITNRRGLAEKQFKGYIESIVYI